LYFGYFILKVKGPNIKRPRVTEGLKAAIDELRKGERVTLLSAKKHIIL
jgi:hypothetical protein